MTNVQRTNRGAVIGALELRQDIHRAYWRGNRINLTSTEFAMVNLMANQAGGDVRYRQLYDLVYGEGFVSGYGIEGFQVNVRSFIKRIRRKFRAVDPEFDRIENYAKVGYCWRIGEAGP